MKTLSKLSVFAAAVTAILSFNTGGWAQSCDWTAARKQIDIVLTEKPDDLRTLRREVADGMDGYEAFMALKSDKDKETVDACRFKAIEYLGKKGFQSMH